MRHWHSRDERRTIRDRVYYAVGFGLLLAAFFGTGVKPLILLAVLAVGTGLLLTLAPLYPDRPTRPHGLAPGVKDRPWFR